MSLEPIATPDGWRILGDHPRTFAESLGPQARASSYLLLNDGEGLLIDASRTTQMADAIRRMVEDSGCMLEAIVLTHHHYDHTDNSRDLARFFDVPVMSHRLDAFLIEDPQAGTDVKQVSKRLGVDFSPTSDLRGTFIDSAEYREATLDVARPQQVDGELIDGQRITVGGWQLEVLHTPGHTPGSISIWNATTGSLYIGDVDFWISPGRPYPLGDVQKQIDTLDRLLKLPIAFLGPGHFGPFIEEEAIEHLESRRSLVNQLLDDVYEAVRSEPGGSLVDIHSQVFQEYPDNNYPPITEGAAHAYLMHLVQLGTVIRHEQGGDVVWYRA